MLDGKLVCIALYDKQARSDLKSVVHLCCEVGIKETVLLIVPPCLTSGWNPGDDEVRWVRYTGTKHGLGSVMMDQQ